MPATEYLPQCIIKIGGSQVPGEFMNALAEAVVDTSLHVPGMFSILLHDPELKWVDDALLEIGKPVEIAMKQSEAHGGVKGTLIVGEITALEPSFSATGETTLLVRGYDKGHRLHRGRQTRTFLKQKDSQIAQKIAGEAGLSADVDATTVTYDYVLQNNQTNMEFLLERAQRIGYQVYVLEGKLSFKKGDAGPSSGVTLALGDALRSFRPCWSATHQVNEITVKGWDPKGKQQIIGTATPSSALKQGGMKKTGGNTAQAAFGAAAEVLTDRPVFTVDEAKALATGLSQDISRDFVEAEGVCAGHPKALAGSKITIKGVGNRFSGDYFVTEATHICNKEGYETRFSISGRQPRTLSDMLDAGDSARGRGLVQGVVTGTVTNLNDPDNLGRVKIKYDWLGEIESDWVRIASPMAGAERGFYYLPEVGDEVLVTFEHGDVHRPYIIGALWSNTDKPPKPNNEATSGGKVVERVLKSRSGHVVILDDTDGSEKITIQDKTGKNELVINSSDNSMSINVDGDFTVKANGKISLSSQQDMTLETKANGTIKTTQNLSAEATGSATVKSLQNTTVEGTAGVTVKNVAAQIALSGPTINMNNGALEVM